MAAEGGHLSTSALVDKVPLIKSPSFWTPPPVELPPDIHPLPDDVHAYFVYPHTIESHALSVLPAALQQLQQSHSQRLHLLTSLAESKERARKARLNQIAPGWAEGGVMEPVRKEVGAGTGARGARSAKPKTDLLEDEEDQVPTPKPKKDVTPEDLFDMGQVESPVEAGDQTLDEARRNQMSDFVDGLFALDSSLGGKKDEEGELI